LSCTARVDVVDDEALDASAARGDDDVFMARDARNGGRHGVNVFV